VSEPTGPTQVVTFYSYKGGVGRTMALVNTAFALAREGWRVLMVDCDLEAPGITHFFAREVRRRPEFVRKDVLDLLLAAKRSLAESDLRQQAPNYPRSLAEYVVPIALPEDWLEKPETGIPYRNGRLDLIPATLEPRRAEADPDAEPSSDYLERLSELDLPSLFLPSGLGHLFGDHVRKHFVSARFEAPGDVLFALRDPVQAAYDVVLIDSRTGLNELAGFSIGTVADSLVICCGLNQQNIEGTRYFMRKTGLFKRRAKRFLVAIGPVPSWYSLEVEQRLKVLRRALRLRPDSDTPLGELVARDDGERIAYEFPGTVEIPYHPRAAIRETVFVAELPRDPISQAYDKLAKKIRSRLLTEGSIDALRQNIYFLMFLDKHGREGLRIFSDSTARQLPELRLQRMGGAPIPAFPTVCGVTSLPNLRHEIRWEDVGRMSVTAACSALQLSSAAPFEQAWKLLPAFRSDGLQRFFARCLIYFQASTSYPLPPGGVDYLSTKSSSDLREDQRVLSDLDLYLVIQKITARDPGRFKVELVNVDKLQESVRKVLALRAVFHSTWRWIEAPVNDETLLKLTRGVESLARGTLREDLGSHKFLAEIYRLPASPQEVLGGDVALRKLGSSTLEMAIDRGTYSDTPLGFWPEPLAATAVALLKGPEAIQEILAWLHLARLHYGYAWRVLVDWRYFEGVKQHPEFQDFLRQEDEVVKDIEAAIDRGEIPL